jgi:glycosyltransferase involved in cell wall biosynthesis
MAVRPAKITIGIPAHNEAANIGHLLEDVFGQVLPDNIQLDKVIVVCDGCTDRTADAVLAFAANENRIVLLDDRERHGKSARMNQIFGLATAAAVVILDGDLRLKDNQVIAELVKPVLAGHCELTAGKITPYDVTRSIQKTALTGINILNRAIALSGNPPMYFCCGPVRTFGQKLYTELRFPNDCVDDVYAYIYADTHGYAFCYTPAAEVYYQLPSTLRDFINQTGRFNESEKINAQIFSIPVAKKYFVVGMRAKITAAIQNMMRQPLRTSLYLALSSYIHLTSSLSSRNKGAFWDRISSSKSYGKT